MATDGGGRRQGTEMMACDVADRAAVAGLFAQLSRYPPVRGVIHAAGVLGKRSDHLVDTGPHRYGVAGQGGRRGTCAGHH